MLSGLHHEMVYNLLDHPAGTSVISVYFGGFTMVVYEKYILKHTQMTNTFDTKIILHKYILY